jgi:predicted GIY-YIG superfamily endonuclease
LEIRFAEHVTGRFGGYTASRRPLALVWSQEFAEISDAITAERQIKRWSRAKKLALINGDFAHLKLLAKRRTNRTTSFETQAAPAPQDEVVSSIAPHPEERPLGRVSKDQVES